MEEILREWPHVIESEYEEEAATTTTQIVSNLANYKYKVDNKNSSAMQR